MLTFYPTIQKPTINRFKFCLKNEITKAYRIVQSEHTQNNWLQPLYIQFDSKILLNWIIISVLLQSVISFFCLSHHTYTQLTFGFLCQLFFSSDQFIGSLHQLFFGVSQFSGNFSQLFFKPTYSFLWVLQRYNVPVCFFCLLFYINDIILQRINNALKISVGAWPYTTVFILKNSLYAFTNSKKLHNSHYCYRKFVRPL